MMRTISLLAALLLTACSLPEASPRQLPELSTRPAEIAASLQRAQEAAKAAVAHREDLLQRMAALSATAPQDRRLLVIDTANRHSLDPALLAAVVHHETGGTWNPAIRGGAGEIGLMQIMPATADWISRHRGIPVPDLTDAAVNLDWGAYLLSLLIREAGGDVGEALRRYNAGPAWRTKAPVMAEKYAIMVMGLMELAGVTF